MRWNTCNGRSNMAGKQTSYPTNDSLSPVVELYVCRLHIKVQLCKCRAQNDDLSHKRGNL